MNLCANSGNLLMIGLVTAIFGYYLTKTMSLPYLKQAWGSKAWPSVEGTILFSEVQARRMSDGGTTYFPVISYEYTISGRTYKGGRLGTSVQGMAFRGSAERKIARYPKGKTVKVYHHPNNLGNSLLEPGLDLTENFLVLLPIPLFMFGIGSLLLIFYCLITSFL